MKGRWGDYAETGWCLLSVIGAAALLLSPAIAAWLTLMVWP